MGAIFSKVKPLIIEIEGEKETDDPDDHGGKTKYGISQKQYPDLDIDNLTEDQAMAILEEDYWQKYHLEQIENQALANQIFFLIINVGPQYAIQIVQIAANVCGRGLMRLAIDGVMGSKTIQIVNSLADGWLSNRIRLEAISYYLQLTDHDKTQIRYFRGWVRRALMQ